ncbi:LacI family transcriptional regulator [Cellulomonas sp. ACRRI]|uniref:LacI family DNA-binding transcriptional regulator n=1 Tax=Cellulomonas sp. ACRRI TaxID=2918188 RepID=UPI001EF1E0F2|nr:LacI family DNA-binding transcriptional regulator [Cellulomonas sp. ACRRI]MCG7287436.1 LacI family transcriptional regulator [Cellulomonas sp. ACRRI]
MDTITLKDVAHAVGVSVMTVSNVVNGRLDRVSPATAARVERAVADLGYVPSAAARTLVARRSRLVGLLLPGRPDGVSLLGSPHDVAVTGALEATLRGRDHHLMLRGVGDARDVRDSVRRWGLDGVVLMGFTDAALAGLDLSPTLATVLVDADGGVVRADGGPAHARVRSDDRAGGRLAGAHLAGLGHRGLVLCGPVDGASRVVAERLAGFRAAAADAGLAADAVRVAHARTTYDEGVALGGRLAADVRAGDVTAAFATADVLAAGVARGLADAGLRVPEDVSVLGYDDAELARQVTPRLSTVAQDTAGKGRLAAELLLGLVTGEDPAPRSATVPVALVARESTAPAPR